MSKAFDLFYESFSGPKHRDCMYQAYLEGQRSLDPEALRDAVQIIRDRQKQVMVSADWMANVIKRLIS